MSSRDWSCHWLCPEFVFSLTPVCVSFVTFFHIWGTAHLLQSLDVGQGVGGMMMGPGLQPICCRALVPPLHRHASGLANIKSCAL